MVGDLVPLHGDRPNLVPTHPTSDLSLPPTVDLPGLLTLRDLQELCAEELKGCFLVLMLGALALNSNLKSRGLVGQLNSGVRGVPVLSTSPTSSAGLEVEITVIQVDFRLSRFTKDCHRHGGSVDPTPLLGWGDTLEAVATSFTLECPLSISARYTEGQVAGAVV